MSITSGARATWQDMLFAAVFAAIVALPGVVTLPPLDRDEARFAEASAQMLESGDFVTIRFQDSERNKKPAGIYWLQAASVAAFSSVEAREIWAYRLPSVVGAMLAAALTAVAGARLFGRDVGRLGALLLAATPLAASEAMIAKTDAALMAAIVAAETALIHVLADARDGRPPERWWPLLFWGALGAGTLLKGPIAPLILVLTIGAVALLRPETRGALLRLRPIMGLIIYGAMVLPWFVAVENATGGRFLAEALGKDMFGKIGAAQESHAGPPGLHIALLPLLAWPAIAFLPAGLASAFRKRTEWPTALLLAWVVPSWLGFEAASTKLPHYVLPLYPPLALLAARGSLAGDLAPPALRRVGAALYLLVGMVFAGATAALPAVYGAGAAPAPIIAALLLAGAAFFIARQVWAGRFAAAAPRAALLSAALTWCLTIAVAPRLYKLDLSRSLSGMAYNAHLHPLRDGAPPVAMAGYSEPSAVFLLGAKTELGDGAAAARHLAAVKGSAALVEDRQLASFLGATSALHLPVVALSSVDGVNYSKGKTAHLTLFVVSPEGARKE